MKDKWSWKRKTLNDFWWETIEEKAVNMLKYVKDTIVSIQLQNMEKHKWDGGEYVRNWLSSCIDRWSVPPKERLERYADYLEEWTNKLWECRNILKSLYKWKDSLNGDRNRDKKNNLDNNKEEGK